VATPTELTLQARAAIIQRFNRRVDQAIVQSAPTKDWVRKALRQGGAEQCPVRLRRLSLDAILQHGDALADLLCEYPDDAVVVPAYEWTVGYQPESHPNRVNPLQILTEQARWTDEWGTEWSHAAGGVGASATSDPIQDWSQLDAYLTERMPNPLVPGRLGGVAPALRMHG